MFFLFAFCLEGFLRPRFALQLLVFQIFILSSPWVSQFKLSNWSRYTIFPKAQIRSKKIVHYFWHHFMAQFWMHLHMAWSILIQVFALRPLSDWEKLKNSLFSKLTLRTEYARRWCKKLKCTFIFEVTFALGKMWITTEGFQNHISFIWFQVCSLSQ